MHNPDNQLPGHVKYINHFLNNYDVSLNFKNLIAISNCYANYKTLGVFYSSDIMKFIYSFDEQFPINDNCVKHIPEVKKIPLEPEDNNISHEYYYTNKLASAQSRVNFTFINFVKASDKFQLLEPDIINEQNKKNDSIKDKNDKNVIKEIDEKMEENSNLNKKTSHLLSYQDALNNETYRENLENFRKQYIQMKILEASLLPLKKLILTVAHKSQISIRFKMEKQKNDDEFLCELIFNDGVLLGKSCNTNSKFAIIEAIKTFQIECFRGIDVNNIVAETNIPKIESESEIKEPIGAEFNELSVLENFYLRNNRSSTAIGIIQESFQSFKMSMAFSERLNKMHLIVCGDSLASIDFCGNPSASKIRLSNYVLNKLQKTKWTLMRNTLYISEFSESLNVAKNGLYDKNLKDETKIESNTNIGGKLMKKMGWDENSGLGKMGHGMKDPIINEMNAKRQGIGFDFGSSKDLKSFANNVTKALRSWMSNEEDDLIFDRQFDNKERAMIHKECRKLGLSSKSYNNANGDRFLVVTNNRSPEDLFNWIQSKGGKTKLYTLMPPGSMDCGMIS